MTLDSIKSSFPFFNINYKLSDQEGATKHFANVGKRPSALQEKITLNISVK